MATRVSYRIRRSMFEEVAERLDLSFDPIVHPCRGHGPVLGW